MAVIVKKCRECKTLFHSTGKDICPECMKKLDDIFMTIRDYLDEHPNAKIPEVAEALEISEKIILDFIKQGRITLKDPVLVCSKCGRPIHTGMMCDECTKSITSQISSVVDAKKYAVDNKDKWHQNSSGMHVKK